jgi:DNA modification methylase
MTVSIRIGDCIEQMRQLDPDSIDCVVTSPPYWGLRDYGVDGQLGLEQTLAEHLTAMIAVFEEVKRVLKPEGTCWVNYGDCYATSPNGRSSADTKATGKDDRTFRDKPFSTVQGVMKPKDLCMVPNRFAIAMQEAGWWVRAENIWGKTNPMPESVRDRPATAHEKIFLFTKSARYFYDDAVVRVGLKSSSIARLAQDIDSQDGSARANGGAKTNGPMKAVARCHKQRGHVRRHDGFATTWDTLSKAEQQAGGRNLRNYEPAPVNVWEIATKPFSDAHFATFPPELAERCIKAGCPAGGTVLDPFGGAGTTGLVADRLQRHAILIELNPEYAAIARRRIDSDRGDLLVAMDG